MFKKILFPTKFGEFSLDILKSITCLKAAGLEEVVLLHVIDTDIPYASLDWGTGADTELIERVAIRRLSPYTDHLRSQDIGAKTRVCKGSLLSEMMKVAAEEQVSLIVAGREQRGILGELFHSSTTPAIVRKSEVPVLIHKYHTIKEIAGQVREFFCADL